VRLADSAGDISVDSTNSGQSVLLLKPLAIHKVLKMFFAEVAFFLSETDLEASELWQEQAPIGSDYARHTVNLR
jgi:hypothetical protein